MRILVLTMNLPFPPVGGGRMRTFHLACALASEHELTLVGFSYDGTPTGPPPFPVEVVAVPWREPPLYEAMAEGDVRATDLLELGDEPWFASAVASPDLERVLARLDLSRFDLALVEETDMARFLDLLPDSLPVVLDLHNVYSAAADDPRTLPFERQAAGRAALCLVCSHPEAERARDLLGAPRVEIVPNGVDAEFFAPQPTRSRPRSLLFTGTMDYGPNVDAVRWFADAVLPAVRAELPDAVLEIVGANPTDAVLALGSDAVVVHGAVPDVRPYLWRSEQVVVPLRSGGGTRLKILEAAAAAKPIVTTPVGCEGLRFGTGELVVADTAQAFADAVVRLAGAPAQREQLSAAARRRARDYDWARIGTRMRALLEDVVAFV